MSYLWLQQQDQWQPLSLSSGVLALSSTGDLREVLPLDAAPLRLRSVGNDWVLLAAPRQRVRINGVPLGLGIRVLRDRDEIVFGHGRSFFSSERLACVEPFPDNQGAVFCARCRTKLDPGAPAVRCPGCACWCHQRDDLGCWLYAGTCPLCDQATALDAGFRWEPEF